MILCSWWESNPHVFADTAPSRLRVYLIPPQEPIYITILFINNLYCILFTNTLSSSIEKYIKKNQNEDHKGDCSYMSNML